MAVTVLAVLLLHHPPPRWPTSRAAARWHPPKAWLTGALCIHRHESADWHLVNRPYSGGLQFTDATFQSVGGRGPAASWSPREQLYRAWLVWLRDGRSWAEWPNTSQACGLT